MSNFMIRNLISSGKWLLNTDQLTYNRLRRFTSRLPLKRRLDVRISTKTKTKRNTYLTISELSVSRLLLQHISNDLGNDSSVIFVANAGHTPLVELLLENNAQMVYAFENHEKAFSILQTIKSKYPKHVEIFNEEILNLPDMYYDLLNLDESGINKWFADIGSRDWSDEPNIKFIAALTPTMSWKFMRFLIKQLLRFELFFSKGRAQFLLLVSGCEVKYLQPKPSINLNDYRTVSVLYNCLFDIDIIQTVPYIGSVKKRSTSPDMKLVRLTPKKCLERYQTEMLIEFYYFVQQTFMKRKRWVIPYLEKFFPNCGPNLIRMGIPVFKLFGQLSPQQVFDIFCLLYNSPDYETSIFKSASTDRYLLDEVEGNNTDKEEVEGNVQEVPEEVEAEKQQS